MSECSIPNGRACLFTFLGFEFSKWRGGRAIACSGGPVTTTVPFSPDQRLVRSWLKLPHSLAIYGPTHCQTALQLEQRRRPCCVAPFGSAEARERERGNSLDRGRWTQCRKFAFIAADRGDQRERTEDSHGTLNLLSLSAMKAFTHKLGEERPNASQGSIFVL